MSTGPFLTWTLLTSGVFALLGIAARRYAVARHGTLPPLTGVQSAIFAALVFLLGAQVTTFVSKGGFGTPSSPLSMPIAGAMAAVVGLSTLYNLKKDGGSFRWQRSMGLFNLIVGALILVLGIVRP